MKEQMQLEKIDRATCVVKGTHLAKGRTIAVSPGPTASRNLFYGRIRIDPGEAAIEFENGTHETGLICLNGSATVSTADGSYSLSRYDALYIPRDSRITVDAPAGCDLAEISSPVENRYPLQYVSFAEIGKDPALRFTAGKPPAERVVNILLGKNIEAGRIMAGVTFSSEGSCWTSWPPHEHANLLEEAYLYIDMPAPQWGVQFVYTNSQQPELAEIVREGDVVLMPQGYHPNVAAPGGPINFLWMMAANNEAVDRKFGVVTVQPEYDTGSSGLEASQK